MLSLIALIAFLECALSVDNALILALLAKPLPRAQQRKALTYGLIGSVVFRLAAIATAVHLVHFRWAKAVGGAYLCYAALSHAFRRGQKKPGVAKPRGFWPTVARIELMDVAFAVDSILAAVAISQDFWVVFTGGLIGVVAVRFAASAFVKILQRVPWLEAVAYVVVGLVGIKTLFETLG